LSAWIQKQNSQNGIAGNVQSNWASSMRSKIESFSRNNTERHLNGLAICAGIGGFDLGLKLVCPTYRTVCYIEREAICASFLVKRMEEGWLDKAPIWSDVGTFDGKPWRGVVDIITAGFPCQPFSRAGRRKKEKDKRWIWPAIERVIEEIRPSIVFLENNTEDAFRRPREGLERLGYEVPPLVRVAAASVGEGHRRRRFFLLAYLDKMWKQQQERIKQEKWGRSCNKDQICSNPYQTRWQDIQGSEKETDLFRLRTADGTGWWDIEPDLVRVVHGIPHRMDRVGALGESVIPAVVACAWENITERLK